MSNKGMTAAALAALLGTIIMGPPAQAAPRGHAIGTFNMAGGYSGDVENGSPARKQGYEPARRVVGSIEDRNTAFLVLQESCRDWASYIRFKLGSAKWGVKFRPVEKTDNPPHPDYPDFSGVARCQERYAGEPKSLRSPFGHTIIWNKDVFGGVRDVTFRTLGVAEPDAKERRIAYCMTSKKMAQVVCSAHTTPPSGGDAWWQIQQLVSKLRKHYIGKYKVFVGADLNLEPHDSLLNALYHRRYGFGSEGNFREAGSYCQNDPDPSKACRSAKMNHWTHETAKGVKRKIDYLFYPPNETISGSAVTHAGLSDHQMLWTHVAF